MEANKLKEKQIEKLRKELDHYLLRIAFKIRNISDKRFKKLEEEWYREKADELGISFLDLKTLMNGGKIPDGKDLVIRDMEELLRKDT